MEKKQFTVSIEFSEEKNFTVGKTEVCDYRNVKQFTLFVYEDQLLRDSIKVTTVCCELLKEFNRIAKRDFSNLSLNIDFHNYYNSMETKYYRLGMYKNYDIRSYHKPVGYNQTTYNYQYVTTVKDMNYEITLQIQTLMNKLKSE